MDNQQFDDWEEDLKVKHREAVEKAIDAVNRLVSLLRQERNDVLRERRALQQSLSYLFDLKKRLEILERSTSSTVKSRVVQKIEKILKENASVLNDEEKLRKLVEQEISSLGSDLKLLNELSNHFRRGATKTFSGEELREMASELHTLNAHLKWRARAEKLEKEEVGKIHKVIERAEIDLPDIFKSIKQGEHPAFGRSK